MTMRYYKGEFKVGSESLKLAYGELAKCRYKGSAYVTDYEKNFTYDLDVIENNIRDRLAHSLANAVKGDLPLTRTPEYKIGGDEYSVDVIVVPTDKLVEVLKNLVNSTKEEIINGIEEFSKSSKETKQGIE